MAPPRRFRLGLALITAVLVATGSATAASAQVSPEERRKQQEEAQRRREEQRRRQEAQRAQRDAAQQEQRAKQLYAQAKQEAERNVERAGELLERLRTEAGETKFFAENAEEIEQLEAAVRTELWTGRAAWQGAATLPTPTTVRLYYGFDETAELGDFEVDRGAKPRVRDGRLVARKADGTLRHRLGLPAGGVWNVELRGRGLGKLVIALEGTSTGSPRDEDVVIEVTSTARRFEATLAPGGGAEPVEAGHDLDQRTTDDTPWSVRIAEVDGTLRAVAVAPGLVELPLVHAAKRADGQPIHLGLHWKSGKLELDSLTFFGPKPTDDGGAAAALPRGVWIPLDERGVEGFATEGTWLLEEGGLLAQERRGRVALAPLLTQGKALGDYTFTVEIFIRDMEERRRLDRRPWLTLILPIGEDTLGTWVFTRQGCHVGGDEAATRHLERLEGDRWYTLTARVVDESLQCFVGKKRVIRQPIADVPATSDRRLTGLGLGVATVDNGAPERLLVRSPKLRLED